VGVRSLGGSAQGDAPPLAAATERPLADRVCVNCVSSRHTGGFRSMMNRGGYARMSLTTSPACCASPQFSLCGASSTRVEGIADIVAEAADKSFLFAKIVREYLRVSRASYRACSVDREDLRTQHACR